jgi:hypothetical protein
LTFSFTLEALYRHVAGTWLWADAKNQRRPSLFRKKICINFLIGASVRPASGEWLQGSQKLVGGLEANSSAPTEPLSE